MFKYIIGIIFAISSTLSFAQNECYSAKELMNLLKEEYGEELSAIGQVENTNEIIAIIANEKTGTWSLILLDSTGTTACPLANGEKYLVVIKPGNKI
jgi:hypothetical protein